MRLKSVFCILCLAVFVIPLPTQAQDGLGDEQIALMQRVFAALRQADTYTRYVENRTTIHTQEVAVTVPDVFSGSSLTSISSTATSTILRGEPFDNIATQTSVIVSEQPLDSEIMVTYTFNAETRYVDGVVYVNASYAQPDPALPILPVGWVVIDDPALWETLGVLDLNEYFANDEETDSRSLEDLLLESPELLNQIVLDVTSTPGALLDGTLVEVINLTLDFAVIFEQGVEVGGGTVSGDELTQSLLASSEIDFVATFMLDENDQLIGNGTSLTITIPNIDAVAYSPDEEVPPGTTIDLRITRLENTVLSKIDDMTLLPVAAPEQP